MDVWVRWALGLALPLLLGHAVWAHNTMIRLTQQINGATGKNGVAGDLKDVMGRLASVEMESARAGDKMAALQEGQTRLDERLNLYGTAITSIQATVAEMNGRLPKGRTR